MATITVDPNTSFQTMTGWEATAEAAQDFNATTQTENAYPSPTFANYKTELLNKMLDLGIDRLRLEVNYADVNAIGYATSPNNPAIQPSTASSGQFHYDRIDRAMDSFVTDYRAMLAAQGETLHITICFVDFRTTGYSVEDTASEMGLLIFKYVDHFYNTYGYLPDAIEPCLEPDNQSGGNWTAAKLANGLANLKTRLDAAGYSSVKFIAPSDTNSDNTTSWYSGMKTAQPSIASWMSEVSYHRYDSVVPTNSDLQAIYAAANADGLKTSMTEWIGATWDTLYADLTQANASAFQQFTITYPYTGRTDNGEQYFDVNTSTWAVSYNIRTKWLRHIFKYVRKGAVRKGFTSDNPNVTGTAFRNSNGSYAVNFYCLENFGHTTTISGLPAGTYAIRYSTGYPTNTAPTAWDQSQSNQTIAAGGTVSVTTSGATMVTVYDVTYMDQPPPPDPGPVLSAGRGIRSLFF